MVMKLFGVVIGYLVWCGIFLVFFLVFLLGFGIYLNGLDVPIIRWFFGYGMLRSLDGHGDLWNVITSVERSGLVIWLYGLFRRAYMLRITMNLRSLWFFKSCTRCVYQLLSAYIWFLFFIIVVIGYSTALSFKIWVTLNSFFSVEIWKFRVGTARD